MFQMFHYYGFFLLLLLTFTEKKYWDWLLKASLVAATAMIFYGVFAAARFSSYIGPYCNGPTIEQCISPTLWGRLSSSARFQGSLGNPAFVAPYLLFSIYYALHLWYTGKKKRWEWRDAFYGSLIVFFLLFFTLSQTRGAFLGLVAGIGAGVLYLIVRHREYRKMAGIFAAILLLLGGSAYLNRKALIDAKVPGSRFLELDLKEVTAQTRFWTWGSAWKGFLDRPIFGWGPENFTRVFDKYFDTRHYNPNQSTETWFDRAHSVVFDYLAETGIVGLAAYLGLITLLVITALSLPYAPLLVAFAVALPVAYFVQGLVLFDVLATYLNLFLVAAFFVNEKTHD
jgi:O-antigen ligase